MIIRKAFALFPVLIFLITAVAGSVEIKADKGPSIDVGLRLQGWGQWIENGAADGSDQTDFFLRRAYLYLKGAVNPHMSYFAHIAGDRIGQSGLDQPSNGLGSGLALRDGWLALNITNQMKLQLGRMYVPFTRAYGTESTFALMTLDVAQFQQGNMIPGRRVGRDDGVTLWGNASGNRLQYRFSLMDGADTSGQTGSVRTAGRVAYNFLDTEADWFNAGTYLSNKSILAVGAGFDRLNNFTGGINHKGWTVDLFANRPAADNSAWTLEAALARIDQDDTRYTGNYYFVTGGYYLPWSFKTHRFQPYARLEKFSLDDNVSAPTTDDREIAAGVNCFLFGEGHKAKLTFDWTTVHPRSSSTNNKGTAQIQISY